MRACPCSGLPCCRAQALGHSGSGVVACGLSSWQHTGVVASQHVGSSQTRGGTHVPCIGKQILNHWTTKEPTHRLFREKKLFFFYSIDILREERHYNQFFSKDKHSGNEKKTLRNVKLGNRILKLNEVGSSSKS